MDRSRFEVFVPDEVRHMRVAIIGCGGIGSFSALALARMGVENFRLVDPERVEEPNLGTQAYTLVDVGLPKVDALSGLLEDINDVEGHRGDLLVRKYRPGDLAGMNVAVASLDSIEPRRQMWEEVQFEWMDNPDLVLVDPRMGLESWEVHVVRSDGPYRERYEAIMKGDHRFKELRCGERAIGYTGMAIASVVAGAVARLVRGEKLEGWCCGVWGCPPEVKSYIKKL